MVWASLPKAAVDPRRVQRRAVGGPPSPPRRGIGFLRPHEPHPDLDDFAQHANAMLVPLGGERRSIISGVSMSASGTVAGS